MLARGKALGGLLDAKQTIGLLYLGFGFINCLDWTWIYIVFKLPTYPNGIKPNVVHYKRKQKTCMGMHAR